MTCKDCGAPTNHASSDGVFRCWSCHCKWLDKKEERVSEGKDEPCLCGECAGDGFNMFPHKARPTVEP